MHKEILTKSSNFFKACCNGHDWKESVTKIVELPDDDFEAVSTYVHWLYYGDLMVTECGGLPPDVRSRPQRERVGIAGSIYPQLGKLSVLSDKVGDDVFTNDVVDCFLTTFEKTWTWPDTAAIQRTHDQLPPSSLVRALLKDIYRSCEKYENAMETRSALSKDFIFDMMVALLQRQGQGQARYPTVVDRCKYHVHNDKVPKCA